MRAAAVFVVLFLTTMSFGDVVSFGEGDNTFEIEFVEIGSVGNAPDTRAIPTGPREIGAVDYEYGISKFEVPCGASDKAGALGAFEFVESNCQGRGELRPAILSPDFAIPFVNWLNTSLGYQPAYDVSQAFSWSPGDLGYNPDDPVRNSLARFFLPKGEESHKAAYYDPVNEAWFDYATGSNEEPTLVASGTDPNTLVAGRVTVFSQLADVNQAGGESAFGTVGQVGNASEWEEGGDENFPDDFWWYSVGVEDRRYSYDRSRRIGRISGGRGIRIVDLGPFEGDFNRDRQVDAEDIDALSEHIRSMGTEELYDANGDGMVDMDDHTFWVENVKGILHGDADMDGAVEFKDFLFLSGSFETKAGWAGGDFNGSGLTDFDDFLTLSGNFGQTVTKVASVPEASSFVLLSLSLLTLGAMKRHAANRTCSKAESSLVSPWTEC